MSAIPASLGTTVVERPWQLLALAGCLGVVVQALVWEAGAGLNAPVIVAVLLAAVVWVARSREVATTPATATVAGVAAVFSVAVAVRAEPFTTAANVLVVLAALAVLVHAYPSDRWLRYGLRDWLLAALRFVGHQFVGPPGLLRAATHERDQDVRADEPARWRRAVPLVRGLLLALPVVAVLTALLASADSIFAERLDSIGDLIRLPDVDEAVGRVLLTLVAAWAIAGGLWHQFQRREPEVLADEAVPRVLGFTEAAVVLLAVDALFVAFVAVQARYFFGGEAAVAAEGLTYADYARRGFAELVLVALASLCLHLALAGLTRRDSRKHRIMFSALTSLLTGLVLVILASAFGRLLLYEQAFGFTRARTVAHVFMVWLGLLLVALLVLALRDRVRLFLLAALLAAVGFAGTLNVVGVDGMIVRNNLAHARAGAELDTAYLATLSPDAAPALTDGLASAEEPLAGELRTALACVVDRTAADDWRSLGLSDVRALRVTADQSLPVPEASVCRGWETP